jgi:hypothetical protein
MKLQLIFHISRPTIRVGTMATKFKSLLTDDKYEITKSDAESCFFEIELLPTTSITLKFQPFYIDFLNLFDQDFFDSFL